MGRKRRIAHHRIPAVGMIVKNIVFPVAERIAAIRNRSQVHIVAIFVYASFIQACHMAPISVVHLDRHLVFLHFPLGVEELVTGILCRNFGNRSPVQVLARIPSLEYVAFTRRNRKDKADAVLVRCRRAFQLAAIRVERPGPRGTITRFS